MSLVFNIFIKLCLIHFCSRDTEKRQIALNKAKILQEKDDNSNVGTKSEPEPSVSPKLEKKKDSEIHLIASLPKPQSLPAHQLFKDKRKVYQVMLFSDSDIELFYLSK